MLWPGIPEPSPKIAVLVLCMLFSGALLTASPLNCLGRPVCSLSADPGVYVTACIAVICACLRLIVLLTCCMPYGIEGQCISLSR